MIRTRLLHFGKLIFCFALVFTTAYFILPFAYAAPGSQTERIEISEVRSDGLNNGQLCFSALFRNNYDVPISNIEAIFLVLDKDNNIVDTCCPSSPARVQPGQGIRISGSVAAQSDASFITIDSCSFKVESGVTKSHYFSSLVEPVSIVNSSGTVESTVEEIFDFSNNPKAIAQAASSVVKLNCFSKDGELFSTGSGFMMFEENILVTNFHVIDGEVQYITAQREGGLNFDVTTVLTFDEASDVVILKTTAQTGMIPLHYAAASDMMKGERVVAIGSPLGIINSVSSGVFSGFVEADGQRYVQFSAAISHGSSGGPVFNNKGQVIGISTASFEDAQNINLAIPVENILSLWNLWDGSEKKLADLNIDDTYNDSTYTVDYVIEHVDSLIGENITVEGYMSYSYFESTSEYAESHIGVVNSDDDILGLICFPGYWTKYSETQDYFDKTRQQRTGIISIELRLKDPKLPDNSGAPTIDNALERAKLFDIYYSVGKKVIFTGTLGYKFYPEIVGKDKAITVYDCEILEIQDIS